MSKPLTVLFYIAYPYYFPHFLPIGRVLEERGDQVRYILSTQQNSELMEEIAQREGLDYGWEEAELFEPTVDAVFFANFFESIAQISATTLFMDHGVGTKHCNYARALEEFDIVLVEGEYRDSSLRHAYPAFAHKLHKVGFSKLDAVVHFSEAEQTHYQEKYHLDPSKPTILYAPTFYPSSIEKMAMDFPQDFTECNIIIKPHYLSLHRKRYAKQQARFRHWASYPNCVVCESSEYSLVPFLHLCDVMISDESSAIFEFTALDKPVILNRFLKLRWSYILNPKKLFNRLDQGIESYRKIGDNAQSYAQMVTMVKANLQHPERYHAIRTAYTQAICGVVDGQVSERIVTLLEEP